jgi:hypothetical protein
MTPYLLCALAFGQMCAFDTILTWVGVKGAYYATHAIHNAAVAYLTLPDIVHTVSRFNAIGEYPTNYDAVALVFALHFYHIAMYFKKFKTDDWLHHILMIFIAMPIGLLVESGSLLGYSLFFTTGLPTILDYILLVGVRNGWVHPLTEKRVNHQLQLWLRAPGAVSHATLTIAYILSKGGGLSFIWIPPFLTYWNGLYFADQVIVDHTKRLFIRDELLTEV